MGVMYCIVVLIGDIIYLGQGLGSCLIQTIDKELITYIIIVNIQDFDIILCMNWLSKHYDFINYNMLVLKKRHQCSTMKAIRLLNKGCRIYRANAIDTKVESKFKLEDMLIVNKFL